MEQYKKIRDIFREAADIIDEMIELDAMDKQGQNVKKQIEAAQGRFMFKMMEIQAMQ